MCNVSSISSETTAVDTSRAGFLLNGDDGDLASNSMPYQTIAFYPCYGVALGRTVFKAEWTTGLRRPRAH
jgi:hypothetical protein